MQIQFRASNQPGELFESHDNDLKRELNDRGTKSPTNYNQKRRQIKQCAWMPTFKKICPDYDTNG
jgi:hypothetical protein